MNKITVKNFVPSNFTMTDRSVMADNLVCCHCGGKFSLISGVCNIIRTDNIDNTGSKKCDATFFCPYCGSVDHFTYYE